MVTRNILLILSLLISAQALAVETKPLRVINAKRIFETKIPSPNHLVNCGGKLWTFSVAEQSLYSIDLTSGASHMAYHFQASKLIYGQAADISALSCRNNNLLVTLNGAEKTERSQILEFGTKPDTMMSGPIHKYLVPELGRINDLFCLKKTCWMLQGKLRVSSDLSQWKDLDVPNILDIPRVNARPDLNPFEDWQSSLIVAKNKYTKGTVSEDGHLALMDPFHTKIIQENAGQWTKWGSFGAWEGSFLAPKSLIFLDNNVIAASDAKLKAIFLFSKDGAYYGIVALGQDKIYTPDYPLGLDSDGGRLYIADFRGGRVDALDLSEFRSKVQVTNPVSVRENLFRRPEVIKDHASSLCLNCHDGTQSNQLYKFVKSNYHHPLECSKCHDPHHQVAARFYLQKPPEALCISCHEDYAKPETNHVFKDHNKKGGSCMDCHKSHAEAPKLLLVQAPKICMDCHKGQSIHHRTVENLTNTDRAKGIKFEDGKMSCVTCHQTHVNWRKGSFLRERDHVRVFCASCHGAKTDVLYKDFHKIMKKKGQQQ